MQHPVATAILYFGLFLFCFSASGANLSSDQEKIELGKMLFFEPRLSSTKKISCSSCHQIDGTDASGADRRSVSEGVFGLHGDRNSPTIWNSGMRSALFWDGRAASLEEQAKGPILHPLEMGTLDAKAAVRALEDIPGYRKMFRRAFRKSENSSITFDEIAQALGAFERTLNTQESPFDLHQKGQVGAMSPQAIRGWEKFQKFACIACHGAPTFMRQDYFIRFPAHEATEYDQKYSFTKDLGRFNATKQFKDRNLWRVPSLRNVAITGPYFHNGSVADLDEAIRVMGKAQLGKNFSKEEVADLVEFLKSLTGKPPKVVRPKLP